MKKVSLLALAISTTVSTLAFAQGGPVVAPAPVAPMPMGAAPCPCPKAFQGFSLGGIVGYGVGTARVNHGGPITDVTGSSLRYDLGVKGFDGGLIVGYMHRFGNIGLGLDFAAKWASTKGQLTANITETDSFTDRAKLKNSLQLRANLGYAICNLVFPKIILGWDNSQWERRVTTADAAAPTSFSTPKKHRFNSFLWGAGVDFLLAKHVIGGFEYIGTAAGKKTMAVKNAADTTEASSFKPQYNTFAFVLKFIY